MKTRGRKARFVGEQGIEEKKQKGEKEVFTGDRWMNGGTEERRNNENSRQGC